MTAPALKLTIELVPKTCWYSNLRTQIRTTDWDRISKETRAAGVCGICGASDVRLSCHERWEYDDEHGVQRLLGFVALSATAATTLSTSAALGGSRSRILARRTFSPANSNRSLNLR